MRRALVVVGFLVVVGVVVWQLFARRGGSSSTTRSSAGSASASTMGSALRGTKRVEPTRRGGRKLSGRVLHRSKPIAATVWLSSSRGGAVVTRETAADGTFVLADLPPDRYTLAAFAPKLAGRSTEIDLRGGDKDSVTLRLQACERDLAGIVVDNSGGAIAAARIEGGGAVAVTGADGRFRLCTANTQIDVIARADGYATEARDLAGGDMDVIFELRPEAVLAGVVKLEGARVPNAAVDASPDPGRTWDRSVVGGSTVTRDDGTFELHGLGAGDFLLTARGEGARTAKAVEAKLELTGTPPVDLSLVRTIEIRGRAHIGKDPAVGIGVWWYSDDGPTVIGKTDATGAFTWPEALPGSGKIEVPDHEIIGGGRRVVGKDPVDLELGPTKSAVIRGRVLSGGAPVADARIISREQSTSGDYGPRTEDDGTFEMHVHGTSHIAAESDELGLASDDVTVEVAAGATRKDVVLDLTRSATVAGKVVDEAGAPLEGAIVQLIGANEEAQIISQNRERGQAVTRDGGAFRVTMLAPQVYSFRVFLGARRVDLVKGATSRVEIKSPGQNVEGVEIAILAKMGTIAGRVVDDRGAPVADAAIEVPGAAAKRRADVDGRFSVPVLARGRYQVIARGRPGMEATVRNITAGTTDLKIVLPAPGSIRVVCNAGVKRLSIYPASGSVMRAPCGVVIDRMPVGHVFARNADDEERAETTSVGQGEVISGKETTITLAETGSRTVEIRVTGGGKPLEKVGCFIDQAGGSVISSGILYFTNKEGIARGKAFAVPSRLQCFAAPEGWSTYEKQIDGKLTEIAIELTPLEP